GKCGFVLEFHQVTSHRAGSFPVAIADLEERDIPNHFSSIFGKRRVAKDLNQHDRREECGLRTNRCLHHPRVAVLDSVQKPRKRAGVNRDHRRSRRRASMSYWTWTFPLTSRRRSYTAISVRISS